MVKWFYSERKNRRCCTGSLISDSSSTSKEITQYQANLDSSFDSNLIISTQQSGIEGIIARSSTSTRTNKILGVLLMDLVQSFTYF